MTVYNIKISLNDRELLTGYLIPTLVKILPLAASVFAFFAAMLAAWLCPDIVYISFSS